ncbi:MAG: LamG domain-containing protein [Phycisphaerae bacterium]|nr:LamG domain-containing protein [Phycisphaerae bacterium]
MDYLKAVVILGIACLWALATSSAAGGIYDRNWPSAGLVSRWSGEGNARDSMGRHHGRVVGAVKYVKGVSGQAFSLDGRAYIDMGNPAGLRITGNQTVALWLKPARLGLRQNLLAKAVGGEGVFNLEPTGRVNYYYGISGGRNNPYDNITAGANVKVGKWTHIVLVRDFKARKLRWYINGVLKSEKVPKFAVAKASNHSLYIGKGYVENYSGLIDEVCIWNRALTAEEIGAVASAGQLVAPVVLRNPKLDSVRLFDGSILLGTIENQDWSITTVYGKFNIPVARVVGFLSKVAARASVSQPASPDVRVVLIDGHVLAGRLSAPLVRLKLPDGQMLKIPVAQIKQCGYRIAPEKPAGVGEARKADKKFPSTAVLRSGDHLAWDSSDMTIRFKSVCGMLDIQSEAIATIAAIKGGMWRVNLKDHSLILGTPASAELKLKLKLGKEISVPRCNITFLTMSSTVAKPTNATTMLLRSGDRLVGKLHDKQLAVRTDYGLVDIPMADIWTIRRLADGKTELTMQKSTVLRGKLKAGSLAMVLGSGVKFNVTVDQIDSITFTRKLPAEVVGKIEALIKELGDPSAAKRKAASQKLIAMGKDTLIVLKRHSNSPSPAVSKGVKEVIDTLEGRVKPESPRSLTPIAPTL